MIVSRSMNIAETCRIPLFLPKVKWRYVLSFYGRGIAEIMPDLIIPTESKVEIQ